MTKLNTLLIDRDGTLSLETEHPYGSHPVELLPGLPEALRRFRDAGFRFFMVSNQGWIGLGICTEEEFQEYLDRLIGILNSEGITFAAIRYCPHHPDDGCSCRKPGIGMWESLREEFPDLVPEKCLCVGDKDKDVQLGMAIGCKTARLDTAKFPRDIEADYTVKDWAELADLILG